MIRALLPLQRYAAALQHLGPRHALLNLLYRARSRTRRFARYARPGRGLEWSGSARAAFLPHSGGASLADGRFAVLGRAQGIGDPPDWEIEAPLLWLFNLHYFGWLHALAGSERRRLALDWAFRYPPGARRPGWMPYPLSLRLRHWAVLFHGEQGWPPAERSRLLASIESQGECLADTLEHHLGGNHLLESAITLKLLATRLAGPAVERWQRRADAVLDRELGEQFLMDGGHFERSVMYHALLTHGLLDLLNVLDERDERRGRLEQLLPGLLHFLAAMRHPDGEIALFNDAAFGIAPPPGALLDYAARLGLRAPGEASGAFPETGYHSWRRGGDALFVDTAPIGPDYLSTHAHGDLFSYELSLDGARVVVDGGTSTYAAGAERDWVRSTLAHNTVEVAGADQCEFFGAFRVGRRARPRDVLARVSEDGLHAAGWHDGYRRLPGRPVHHRELAYRPEGALFVWDTVDACAPQDAVSRVRFAPDVRVALAGLDAATIEAGRERLTLRAYGGALEVEPGYYASRFGSREPCPVVALRTRAREFGYALFRRVLSVRIDAASGQLGDRAVARLARRPPATGAGA